MKVAFARPVTMPLVGVLALFKHIRVAAEAHEGYEGGDTWSVQVSVERASQSATSSQPTKATKAMKRRSAAELKIVSKQRSAAKGRKNPWILACIAARKALHVKGLPFVKKGTALYEKAMALYKK